MLEYTKIYSKKYPEWHLKRYNAKGLRLLDHIYHCFVGNTPKELLYKSGLDELAANFHLMDEVNLLARKPAELYEGLSMRILRALNCYMGAVLLSKKCMREYILKLNSKFPEIFEEKLNDAQCMYLDFLIKGDLTVDESGRLFQSRRNNLVGMWSISSLDLFLMQEFKNVEMNKTMIFKEHKY